MSTTPDQLAVMLEDKFAELIGPVWEAITNLQSQHDEFVNVMLIAIQEGTLKDVWMEKSEELWNLGLEAAFKKIVSERTSKKSKGEST